MNNLAWHNNRLDANIPPYCLSAGALSRRGKEFFSARSAALREYIFPVKIEPLK